LHCIICGIDIYDNKICNCGFNTSEPKATDDIILGNLSWQEVCEKMFLFAKIAYGHCHANGISKVFKCSPATASNNYKYGKALIEKPELKRCKTKQELALILNGKFLADVPERESFICDFIWNEWETLSFTQGWNKLYKNNWMRGIKRFDIAANNAESDCLIVEVKKGEGKIAAILQLIDYMAMMMPSYRNVYGILIAKKFEYLVYDAAKRLTRNIELMYYEYCGENRLRFNDIDETTILTHSIDRQTAEELLGKLK